MSTYDCHICGGYISPEHGGLSCHGCGAISCIDENCSPKEFVNGHSIEIPYCRKCKKHVNKKDLKKAFDFFHEKDTAYGFQTGLYYVLDWARRNRSMSLTEFSKFVDKKLENFRQSGKYEL